MDTRLRSSLGHRANCAQHLLAVSHILLHKLVELVRNLEERGQLCNDDATYMCNCLGALAALLSTLEESFYLYEKREQLYTTYREAEVQLRLLQRLALLIEYRALFHHYQLPEHMDQAKKEVGLARALLTEFDSILDDFDVEILVLMENTNDLTLTESDTRQEVCNCAYIDSLLRCFSDEAGPECLSDGEDSFVSGDDMSTAATVVASPTDSVTTSITEIAPRQVQQILAMFSYLDISDVDYPDACDYDPLSGKVTYSCSGSSSVLQADKSLSLPQYRPDTLSSMQVSALTLGAPVTIEAMTVHLVQTQTADQPTAYHAQILDGLILAMEGAWRESLLRTAQT